MPNMPSSAPSSRPRKRKLEPQTLNKIQNLKRKKRKLQKFWKSDRFSGKYFWIFKWKFKFSKLKLRSASKEYLIKWKGTNENGAAWDDTWEHCETIANEAPNELGRFLAYSTCLSFSEEEDLPFAVRRKIDEIENSGETSDFSGDEV